MPAQCHDDGRPCAHHRQEGRGRLGLITLFGSGETARCAGGDPPPRPLTDRQRDCVLWAARGKSDWEISRILGVSEQTVISHLAHARERYGVQNRTLLAIRALIDGTLTFTDIMKR